VLTAAYLPGVGMPAQKSRAICNARLGCRRAGEMPVGIRYAAKRLY